MFIVDIRSTSRSTSISLLTLRGSDTSACKTVGHRTSIFKNNETARIGGCRPCACKIRHLADFQCDLQESKKKSTILPTKYSAFLVENSGIEPLTSCMPCKRSPERYRNTPPTRKCGDRLNIALIRSIHQKGSQLHPASRNHAPPTRQFYHPIFKCVNGFCSERRSFTRKVFSDSLLSAILILHIKVALFIFPKSIDKEVFSTMPMYYRCFLSMNQPHDP